MKIGARIKQRRLEIGMSVEELASALGKNRATVYRYENGDIENMPTPILEPIAQILNTTPAYLMGYEDNLEGSADFITELLKDKLLIEHLHSLMALDDSKKQSVYDMIDFLSKEKGP
ncbi:MAG: helix-turn-helix domain-containing protein [Lachnospiraceae bacterium]